MLNLTATQSRGVVFSAVNLIRGIAVCGAILQLPAGALPRLGSWSNGFGYNDLGVAGMAASGALPMPNVRPYSQGLIFTSPLLGAALLQYPLGLIGAFASLTFRVFRPHSYPLRSHMDIHTLIIRCTDPPAPFFEGAGGVAVGLSKFITPMPLTQSKESHSKR